MIQRISGLLACLALAACATPYQSGSGSLTGGHAEVHGPGKMELVEFSGNGYTSMELAAQYVTYRCAEVAKAKGKPYFIMYDTLINAARDVPSYRPLVGSIQNKPSATTFVLLLDAPRRGAQETSTVLTDLQPVIDSGKEKKI